MRSGQECFSEKWAEMRIDEKFDSNDMIIEFTLRVSCLRTEQEMETIFNHCSEFFLKYKPRDFIPPEK